MKTTKKIISLLLTIQMLLACALIPGVTATDVVVETSVIVSESSEELSPMMANECPTYIPGIGWTGTQDWYNAIATVQAGGHIQGWGSSGVYLSESNAKMLITAAGFTVCGEVERDDDEHPYPHIHYWRNNSRHNSIRVLG